MRSVLFVFVILLASIAEATPAVLLGGSDEYSQAKLLGLGVLEDASSCSDTRKRLEADLAKTASTYLVPAAFPLPVKSKPSEGTGCEVDVEVANGVIDGLSAKIGEITRPKRNDIACVAAAQKRFAKTTNEYRSCPVNTTTPGMEAPCRTENTVSTMTRALNVVSECLGIDRRELFQQAAESNGMVPDAFTPRIESAMRTVRDTELGLAGENSAREAGEFIAKAMRNNTLCASLSQMAFNFANAEEKSACERMVQPGGAFLPLYFQAKSVLLLRANLDSLRKDFDLGRKTAAVRKKFGSEAEYQSVLRALALSGTIAGEVHVRATFAALLHRDFKSGKEFVTLFRTELAARIPAEVRAAVVDFSERFDKSVREVNLDSGGSECFSR